jgi:hypothetical protein
MKALGPTFSTLIFALPILATATMARAESNSCVAKAPPAPADSPARAAYPTFCSIPKRPTDIRSPAAFKAAVLDTRRSGVALVRATGPGTFELPEGGAGAFAREARAEASPPAPMNPQNVADAAAFARDARAKAAPPARPH